MGSPFPFVRNRAGLPRRSTQAPHSTRRSVRNVIEYRRSATGGIMIGDKVSIELDIEATLQAE